MSDIEATLRALVRQELARLLGVDPDELEADAADDADLRARAEARAARMVSGAGRRKAGAR